MIFIQIQGLPLERVSTNFDDETHTHQSKKELKKKVRFTNLEKK